MELCTDVDKNHHSSRTTSVPVAEHLLRHHANNTDYTPKNQSVAEAGTGKTGHHRINLSSIERKLDRYRHVPSALWYSPQEQ